MRVLLVANTLPPTDVSGVGEQVLQLAAGLRQRGLETEILGRGPSGCRGPKWLFPIAAVPAVLRARRRFRPHVVQVHESDGALVALALRTLRPRLEPQPTLVALLQVSYLEELRAVRALRAEGRILGRPGWREWAFRWLKAPIQVAFGCLTAWLADRLLAPSLQTAHEIERDYRVEGVEVLPNAAGGHAVQTAAVGDSLPTGFLLFVGRLRIRKGLEVLLHAMARIRGEVPDLCLVVAGDGEHRGRLEAAVARLGLGRQVVFLGRCSAGQVRTLMTDARALVVPSIYEGMPLVILEAMMAGLPVVASRVSGIPEVVQHGRTGWLVAPEDVEELARVLVTVVREPTLARQRGEAGRAWVRREAGAERIAARWLELVIDRQDRSRPAVGAAE